MTWLYSNIVKEIDIVVSAEETKGFPGLSDFWGKILKVQKLPNRRKLNCVIKKTKTPSGFSKLFADLNIKY